MKGGQLRHRVALYRLPTSSDDTFGQPDPTGVLVGTFWAFVEPLTGRERTIGGKQLRGDETHTVHMRWQGAAQPITVQHWLIFQGRRLNITEALNVKEVQREYLILCTEVLTP